MKIDTHIHSHFSYDSIASFDRIISHAKNRAMSAIAITDHEYFHSSILEDIAQESGIQVINGCEIQTEYHDILALFIKKRLKSCLSSDLIDEIHDQEGIAILSHPFKYVKRYPTWLIEKLDAVEVINARWHDLRNFLEVTAVSDLLKAARSHTAGSDAHFPWEIGRAYMIIDGIKTEAELKELIINRAAELKAETFSIYPDLLSQYIKFCKRPVAAQFVRLHGSFFRVFLRMLNKKTMG
jgi:predicted metal-dependent phosphoesterase TrpH